MKRVMMRVEFKIEVPEGRNAPPSDDPWDGRLTGKPISNEELRAYIEEALRYWGGQRHPADPLFDGLTVRKLKMTKHEWQS